MGSIDHNAGLLDDDFSSYEQVYLMMSRAFKHLDKEHWGIYCICSIHYDALTGTDIIGALRDAWMRLVIEYPRLSMVPDGLHKQYPRLDKTNILALYYLPTSSEVVLLIQHWRADGLGACMLLDRLFDLLAESNNPSNPGDLSEPNPPSPSPSLESAAAASTAEDPEIQAYARDYIDNFHKRAVNAGGLPFRGDATTPPSRPAHYNVEFPASHTTAIATACKHRNISVSAAIHTALARTVFSYLPEPERALGYTTVMAVNMRPYLPSPYNLKTHACQTYVASITPTVRYDSCFVDAARSLTGEYQNWWSEKFMHSLCWIYKYHLAKLSAGRRPPSEGSAPTKPPSGVTLSSLGVVEKNLRGSYGERVKVTEFRFGVNMMTRQMILYAWTFKGRLGLSLCYNEAYYDKGMAREVVERVAEHLAEGLELKVDS
ncbi:hypothetical protein GQ43DRAFT_386884, partial [Delitschia confertaspora ATCC 74209]